MKKHYSNQRSNISNITKKELDILETIETIEYVEGHRSDDLQYFFKVLNPLCPSAGAAPCIRHEYGVGQGGYYGR